ncbi:MAG: DUF819 domain-containing protein [Firmicutes bacterium]|nr:DUF819 domain-containing protein [Bacillota bacterium]
MNTSLISAENTWALFAIIAGIATLAVWLEQKTRIGSKLTGCVMALIGAMILSNTGIIPLDAAAYDFVWDYIIPLSIPMLLFNADIRKIGRESGRLLIIYLISGIGTIAGGILAFNLLKGAFADLGLVLPMMIGTYTGGSVNLVAMADAYQVGGELVSSSVVADNLLMALYFFALIAAAGSKFFLKKYRHPLIDELQSAGGGDGSPAGAASFWTPKQISLKDIALCIALSLAIVAVSVKLSGVLGEVIPTSNFGLALLNGLLGSQYLIITTLTMLVATLFPKQVGSIPGAQEIGTYLIHIFFAVIGVPASIYMIVTKAPLLLLFCGMIVFMNMLFSFIFGKVFRFSLEEIIIASNANIGGPTTAAAMAIAKGWNALIVPAILVGTLGYVLGNYYGIFAGTMIGL